MQINGHDVFSIHMLTHRQQRNDQGTLPLLLASGCIQTPIHLRNSAKKLWRNLSVLYQHEIKIMSISNRNECLIFGWVRLRLHCDVIFPFPFVFLFCSGFVNTHLNNNNIITGRQRNLVIGRRDIRFQTDTKCAHGKG